MTITELLACPFCGDNRIGMSADVEKKSDGRRFYYISCDRCEAAGPTDYDLNEARRLWNTRREEDD